MSVEAATATVFSPVSGSSNGLQAQDGAGEDGHQHPGHQGVADRPADDPVDLVEAVARDRDADRDGHRKDPGVDDEGRDVHAIIRADGGLDHHADEAHRRDGQRRQEPADLQALDTIPATVSRRQRGDRQGSRALPSRR